MQKETIPSQRQINLQPGLWQLAKNLENGKLDENRLCELRGMIRVLGGLAGCLHGAFENDDQVLQKEFDHLVADVHAEQRHHNEKNHNQVHADVCAMVNTMLSMASDNVIAVSKIDCARVFVGALESAEEILAMPKPPQSYLSEAHGMIDAVCELLHVDSYFPFQDIEIAKQLKAEVKGGSIKSVRLLKSHLQKMGG